MGKVAVPRNFLSEPKRFAYLVVRHSKVIVPLMLVLTLVFGIFGMNLSWTAKLFDDLPAGHPAGQSTYLIGKKLAGLPPWTLWSGAIDSRHRGRIRPISNACTKLRKSFVVAKTLARF